jgi:hypothetical protein
VYAAAVYKITLQCRSRSCLALTCRRRPATALCQARRTDCAYRHLLCLCDATISSSSSNKAAGCGSMVGVLVQQHSSLALALSTDSSSSSKGAQQVLVALLLLLLLTPAVCGSSSCCCSSSSCSSCRQRSRLTWYVNKLSLSCIMKHMLRCSRRLYSLYCSNSDSQLVGVSCSAAVLCRCCIHVSF